jgi:L-rhamnose isomerase
VSYTIIYIPTKNSSNEIESLLVIFIHLQLTLGRVVECSQDHVCLLDNLPNSITLTQEIVASSVFPVTEILIIENHLLDSTFLYVVFMSQSLLKPTGDQIGSDTNCKTGAGDQRGGGE